MPRDRGTWLAFAAGTIGVLGITALAVLNATVAVVVLVLIAVAVFAWLRPLHFVYVLALLTAAFPKAGVKVGTFPFPLFLFGLVLAIVVLWVRSDRSRHPGLATALTYLFISLALIRVVVYAATAGIGQAAAFAAWAIVPLVMLYLSTQLRGVPVGFRRSMEAGFLVAVVYGFVQLVLGVDQVAVEGLTYAYGDDLSGKNNIIFGSDGGETSKIPSTYQNGNLFGITGALFVLLAVIRIIRGRAGRLDWVVLVGGISAVTLSGSRTALIALLVGAVLIALGRGALSRKLTIAVIAIGGVGAGLALQPGLATRYSVSAITSTGGAGRAELWSDLLARTPWTYLVVGTPYYKLTEGWLGVLLQVGVIGAVLLVTAAVLLTANQPTWRLPLCVVAVAMLLDSSYMLFPTMFIPAAMAAVPVLDDSVEKVPGVSAHDARAVRPAVVLAPR